MKADAEVNDVNYSSGGERAIARSPVQSNCQQSHYIYIYITNLLRLNRKWGTYNRGSNDNFKF